MLLTIIIMLPQLLPKRFDYFIQRTIFYGFCLVNKIVILIKR